MDLIISAASMLVQYLGAPIYNEIRYCFTYGKHTKNLKQQVDKLKDMREDVRSSVEAATRNGGTIKDSVERWLADADKMIEEAEQIDLESDKRDLCTWFARYKLTKEAFKKTSDVTDLQSRRTETDDVAVLLPPLDIDFLPDSTLAGVTSGASTSTVSREIALHNKTVDEIISRQTDDVKEIVFQHKDAVEKIFHALQDDDCDIIGIYGMGGIGKTTLAKEIGRMAKACGLFDEVVMAVVSQNPDMRRIQGEFGDLLGLYFSEETVKGRAGRLYERLTTQKRTLVVLDDVWSSIDVRSIGIPTNGGNKGCKILITTRQRNLCRNMGFRKGQEIPVKHLSTEDSLDLLKINATPKNDSWTTSHLDDVSKEVARECGGLPLAIVTVGRALRGKTQVKEWKAALKQLKKSKPLNVNDEEKGVFSCLKLSYDYLKSKEAKQCFLLASLFPEDHDIDVEDIVRYGTGIGLFKDVDSVEDAREETLLITTNLVDACLLMNNHKKDRVKMHDVVRDFAIFISTGFLVKSGLELMEWPNRETFEQYTIISLIRNRIKALPAGLICPNLEMLLLGEHEDFEVISDAFFEGMKRLRVLDLSKRNEYSRSSADASELLNRMTFPSSMAALVDLHTLNLNDCMLGDISILGKLKRLEILSLYYSDIDTLPKEIGELTNLRLLDLNFCHKLKHIPANLLSRLTRLEELYMWQSFEDWGVADSENQETGMACLSELTSLHHLTNLCIQAQNPKSFPQDFHVPNLEKFEIAIGGYYRSLTCYPSSRILYVEEIKRSLPKGVMDMIQTTEELTLCRLNDESVKSIIDVDQGGLSSLKSLTVRRCVETVFMMDVPARDAPALFSNLDTLCLEWLDNMEDICRSSLPEGSLHKLKTLKVEYCWKLDSIVTGLMLLRLLSLEEINVFQCAKATHIFGHMGTAITGTETLLLSNLGRIYLGSLHELKAIWIGLNPESPAISLNKLTEVGIHDCTKLSYIFPACVAESLVLLEVIKLEGCLNLKSIVAKGTQGNQPVYFSNLREIEVVDCTSLKSLFSVAEARNLRHLETIKVGYSDNITELISHDDKGGGGGESMILLPKLSTIKVSYLSNMSRLCAKSLTVDLPSLEDLGIEECPLMESNGVDLTKLGVEDLPMLKRAEIGEQKFSGEAIKHLFFSSGKKSITNNQGKKPLELKHLLKSG